MSDITKFFSVFTEMSLKDENDRLRGELARLRQVLLQHGLHNEEKAEAVSCAVEPPHVKLRSFADECNHTLTKEQIERYSRHLLLPSFGLAAQQGVCSSSVLVIGCGGLGSPAALYLAASGIGGWAEC